MSSESEDPNRPERDEPETEVTPPETPGGEVPPAAPAEPEPPAEPAGEVPYEPVNEPEPEPEPEPMPPPVEEHVEEPAPPVADPEPAYQEYPPRAAAAGAGTSFDFAAVPRSVWISFGGAVVLLLSVFFDWYTASVGPFSVSGSGWDTTDVAKLVFLLAVIAVAAWAVDLFAPTVDLPWPAAMIAGAAGAVAAVLVLYRIISKPHAGELSSAAAKAAGISYGTAWGIWVALLAAIAVVVGAYLRMNERA